MSKQKAFYHAGTKKKLDAVEAYLKSFLSVMSNQRHFETIYIDAFAGTGIIPIQKQDDASGDLIDAAEFGIGSALRALALEKKFSRYIFIDQSGAKLNELKDNVTELDAGKSSIEFLKGDAVAKLDGLCSLIAKPSVRAVVFLDPFGNQVPWELLESLARTEHVDLLYLFPAMLGVYRQIAQMDAKMTPEQEASMDRLFGPHDWRSEFIGEESEEDLFGRRTVKRKTADVNSITNFQIKCMRKVFRGCVLDDWLPLGRKGNHWYSLIFAMANPNRSAVEIGSRIARHIMQHT